MKPQILILTALVVLFALPAHAGPEMNAKSLDWRMEELIRLAASELETIDALLDSADRPAVRRELHRKTAELDGLLVEIRAVGRDLAHVAANPIVVVHEKEVVLAQPSVVVVHEKEVVVAPPAYIEEPGPVACDSADFDRVYKAVKAEPFSDDKVRVLRSAVIDRWFTVAQVKTMMETTAFGGERVEIAAMMHPKVVDMQNWFTIYESLTFDSEKDELRQRVGD